MQKLLVAFCFIVSVVYAEVAIDGAKIGKWTMDIEAAFELSQEKELPMLINFTGSDWCGWCKLMDRNVFAKQVWKDYAKDNLVLVTIDFPSDKTIVPDKYKDRNKELAEKFGVRGYPTYILLDHKQNEIGQLGAGRDKTPESFRNEVQAYIHLNPQGVERTLKKLSKVEQEKYKLLLEKHEAVIDLLEKWLETQPNRSKENLEKYQNFLDKIEAVESQLRKFW